MSTRIIQNDLDAILTAISDLPPLVKENEPAPVDSSDKSNSRQYKFMRSKLYPVTTTPASFGEGGFDNHSGFYEITLFVPAGKGVDEVNHFSDLIIQAFKIGTLDTLSDMCIRVDGHSRGVGREHTNHYMLPVTIDYFAYIKRNV